MNSYLYKITNLINGKVYIGQTVNPKRRWYTHQRRKDGCPKLYAAINKYGADNFRFEILVIGSKEYINNLESLAIEKFDSMENGYNIRPGGDVCSGYKIAKRRDDKAIYINDFWFPATRYALPVFCRNGETIKRKGFLGRVMPKFGTPEYTLVRSKGMKGVNSGSSNGMYGRRNTSRSRAIIIEGVCYPSLTDAVNLTEYTKSQIQKRIIKGHPDFKYAQESTG